MLNPNTKIYVKIGGRKITLPVNPEEIQVTFPNVDKTAEVAGIGEILIPQKPGLKEVSFSSFFPGDNDDPYTHNYRNPRTLAKAFERAWKSRTRCRMIIARSIDYDTNMRCVISDWKISDRGGEPNDLYYEVTFRECRSYGVSQMTVVTATEGAVKAITASTSAVREVDPSQLVVGATVALNGIYYATSDATSAIKTANGQTATLRRIEPGTAAPYYVDGMGWFRAESVTGGA